MRRRGSLVLWFALVVLAAGDARAHAWLDHAAPAVGSSVHAPPAEARLTFTQELELAFCTIRVMDAGGRRVDMNDAAVDSRNRAVLRVSLPRLSPGSYKVIWRVLSVDGHVTEGDYPFRIAP